MTIWSWGKGSAQDLTGTFPSAGSRLFGRQRGVALVHQAQLELTAGALSGPVESGTWDGKLMGAPFWANTQLLWFRKSVAQAAGNSLSS